MKVPEMTALPDDRERLLAVSTFDRNVVVTAGAGTGKTTLLVDRITHLLMRETDPLKISDIIAITFTKKAANEMKMRLRSRLRYFIDRSEGKGKAGYYEDALLDELMHRYSHAMDTIAEISRGAINDLEKAQIGTIHSFAGHILRLYPVEAGISPDFEEDDGSGFDAHFEREWEEWLEEELSAVSPRGDEWKEILRRVPIGSVALFAKCLCRETIPLSSLEDKRHTGNVDNSNILDWVRKEKGSALDILNRYQDSRKVKMHGLLMKSVELFENLIEGVDIEKLFDDTIPPRPPSGWTEEDYGEAARVVAVAQSLSAADEAFVSKLSDLIVPFALRCRRMFASSGYLSFDGLLASCCNVLKNKQNIRTNLKNRFKSILVDEFQDTDPVQYEIILYLAEDEDRFEKEWCRVQLMPGKLFIVGDPKQSIYAFRGADISAYHRVVDLITSQGGCVVNLTTNFRSHRGIIDAVNSVCRRVIRRRDDIQPEYVDISACPGREAVKPLQRVEMRLVDTRHEDDRDAAEPVEREALALGKFLKDEMIGKEVIADSDGSESPVSPGHIAILLPKLTQVHEYLDVFKRLRIPYIVEGDRHFYGTQEVVDFVNLLRVLDNPLDLTAMAGVLRSPFGGLSDRELYELCRLSLLDFRMEASVLNDGLAKVTYSSDGKRRGEEFIELVPELYGLMNRLYLNVSMLPVPDAIHYIFDNSPVIELAASSYHGEQSVANLHKICRIAGAMSEKSNLTLKGLTTLLEKRVASREKEGESLLSEEGVDAVRVLSIHRAKGLEFPVVVVGGLHGIPNRGREAASVTHDWTGGMTGISVSGLGNYSAVMMGDKERLTEKEEMRRLLYVAMTRARECLILSGVLGKRIYKDSYLSILTDAMRGRCGDGPADEIRIDEGLIKQTLIDYKSCAIADMKANVLMKSDKRISPERIEMLSGLWENRDRAYRAILNSPFFVTPSAIEGHCTEVRHEVQIPHVNGSKTREYSILVGNIAHYILLNWDYNLDTAMFKNAVGDACRKFTHQPDLLDTLQSELEGIFEVYSTSSVYEELKNAEILAREVPFSVPWDGRVMEGVIDIIYRCGDGIFAADYKTDRVREDEIDSKKDEYSASVDIYANAIRKCTGFDIKGFKLVFLRHGIWCKFET